MYHQRAKLQQISIISFCVAFLFGLFGLFNSFQLFIYLALYCLVVSIAIEAILFHLSLHRMEAMKLIVITVLLFTCITYLFLKFLQGS